MLVFNQKALNAQDTTIFKDHMKALFLNTKWRYYGPYAQDRFFRQF